MKNMRSSVYGMGSKGAWCRIVVLIIVLTQFFAGCLGHENNEPIEAVLKHSGVEQEIVANWKNASDLYICDKIKLGEKGSRFIVVFNEPVTYNDKAVSIQFEVAQKAFEVKSPWTGIYIDDFIYPIKCTIVTAEGELVHSTIVGRAGMSVDVRFPDANYRVREIHFISELHEELVNFRIHAFVPL